MLKHELGENRRNHARCSKRVIRDSLGEPAKNSGPRTD